MNIEKIVEEFLSRQRDGDVPDYLDYVRRFPELSDEILATLPALALVEVAKNGDPKRDGRTDDSPPPAVLGDYRILREIGRGGMGIVYRAEQLSLGRRVALKLLPIHFANEGNARTRFEKEARAAARMHHSNIVPVFEVGENDGRIFYAMQLIEGASLDRIILEIDSLSDEVRCSSHQGTHESEAELSVSSRSLASAFLKDRFVKTRRETSLPTPCYDEQPVDRESILAMQSKSTEKYSSLAQNGSDSTFRHRPFYRGVARLGHQVSDALSYAHARGIIHRDIKPSNLILDDSGVIWVTDFGLAKTDDDKMTRSGDFLGTLRYMSPERFRGEYDHRADIYSLGLTMYELLARRPAFETSDRLRLIEAISNSEPARLKTIDPQIPRDLETIVMKSMEKDPNARYESAMAMAEDLRRFLGDMPIKARRMSTMERLTRWGRRNRTLASALITCIALLVFLAVAGPIAYVHEVSLSKKLRTATSQANQAAQHANQLAANTLLNYADRAFEDRHFQTAAILAAESLRIQESAQGSAKLRSARANMLASLVWTSPALHEITSFDCSPDGRFIAAASGTDEGIWLWEADSQQDPRYFEGHEGTVLSLAFHPHGNHLLSGARDQSVRMWEFRTGKTTWIRPLGSVITAVSISPNGKTAAVGGAFRGTIWILDCKTGRIVKQLDGNGSELSDLKFSPSGKSLAAGFRDGSLYWHDLSSAKVQVSSRSDEVTSLVFLDERRVIVGAGDGSVYLSNADGHSTQELLKHHGKAVTSISLTTDSTELAVGFVDGTIRFLSLTTMQELTESSIQLKGQVSVKYSPDDVHLITGIANDNRSRAGDRAVQLIHRATKKISAWTMGHTHYVDEVVFGRGGRTVVSAGEDGTIRIWDVISGRLIRRLGGHDQYVRSIDVHANGELIVSGADDQFLRIWDATTGLECAPSVQLPEIVTAVAFHPSGRYLAALTTQQLFLFEMKVTNAASSSQARSDSIPINRYHLQPLEAAIRLPEVITTKKGIRPICFNADGENLAIGHDNGDVSLWNFDRREPITHIRAHSQRVVSVQFGSDSTTLISAGSDNQIVVWDVSSVERPTERQRVEHDRVYSAVLDSQHRLLATSSGDRMVRFWSLDSGHLLGELEGHRRRVQTIQFDPTGRYLATGAYDEVRVFRINTAASESGLAEFAWIRGVDSINRVDYCRDGHFLVAKCNDACRLVDTRTNEIQLFPDAQDITIDPQGRVVAISLQHGLRIIDLRSNESFVIETSQSPLAQLVMNASATRLAGRLDGEIYIWDLEERKLINSMYAHDGTMSDLAFSPTDPRLLASSSRDRMIYLWDVFADSKDPISSLRGHSDNVYSITFSHNGRRLASSSTGDHPSVLLWDVASGRILHRLRGHELGIDAVAFSPDGKQVASGCRDMTVRLWDAKTGVELARFVDHRDEVKQLVFTPDGKQLISCDRHGGLHVRSLQAAAKPIKDSLDQVELETGLFLDGETVRLRRKRAQWWIERPAAPHLGP